MPCVYFKQSLGLTRDAAANMLRAGGCHYDILWAGDTIGEKAGDVEVFVASQHKIGRDELCRFDNLKLVSLAYTGHDEVDKDYCRSRKLHVSYVPGYSTVSVAELAVFMAGELLRKLSRAIALMREGDWNTATQHAVKDARPRELQGRTVGILGTGAIGMATARLFHAFGCPLIGWTNRPERHPEFEQLGGTFLRTKEEVFENADIVSLHLELNDDTKHTANAARLALMPKDSMLINTARTYLVDPAALSDWLRANPDKGAALDITKKEQFESVFVGFENLLLTPHLGCQTDQAAAELARVTIANIGQFLNPRLQNQLLPD